jgi:Ti-type conjugative transfer relaxase TraA
MRSGELTPPRHPKAGKPARSLVATKGRAGRLAPSPSGDSSKPEHRLDMATAYHCNVTPHSRSKGHSAVAGAAYRSGSTMTDERTGEIHDYTRKQGVEHSEIVLPANAPEWAHDRHALWNAAEAAENRINSTVDFEYKVSFPAQLSFEDRREMARQFSEEIVGRHGVAVDFAMHEPDKGGDDRNYHAHIMLSTRRLDENGFGEKARELSSYGIRVEHLEHFRERWAAISGNALEKTGHSEEAARWRSGHLTMGKQVEAAANRGDWEFVRENTDRVPQIHLGQDATELERRGVETRLGDTNRENEAARKEALAERESTARKLESTPSLLVDKVMDRKAVFDHRDLARELHLHVDDPAKFQEIMTRAKASDKLVQLAPERFENGVRTPTKYSTVEMIDLEKNLVNRAEFMSERHTHAVDSNKVESVLASRPMMTDEQRELVRQITSDRQFSAVVGDAGTGKSYSMGAAREVWEHSGYRVHGLALAGKASEELQLSSGIQSNTIASWEIRLDKGIEKLTSKDVLVVDEAGMVGSKQLDHILSEADKAGAKVVWAGDHKQLEAINAGAGFRTVVERVNASELTQVQRQKAEWQKDASYQLARGDFRAGLEAYNVNGNVHMAETRAQAHQMLVSRYMSERGMLSADGKPATQAIMAHANKDVRELNQAVRENLKQSGKLDEGTEVETAKGVREFADGDRFVFLKNDKDLGVKNGTLGSVERFNGDTMSVKLDTGKTVVFNPSKYDSFDHGYALTVHKEQGASVDRAYPLATPGMDRSLSYVSMTRHKEEVNLYAAREDFRNYDQLAARMGRENRKESTLDYLDKAAMKSRDSTAAEQIKPKEAEARTVERGQAKQESNDEQRRAEFHKPDRQLLAARRAAGQTELGLHELSEIRVARISAEGERIEARDEGVLSGAVRDSGSEHDRVHDARGGGKLNVQEVARPATQETAKSVEGDQIEVRSPDVQEALERAREPAREAQGESFAEAKPEGVQPGAAQQSEQAEKAVAEQLDEGSAAQPNALQQALAQQEEQRATQQSEHGQDALSRALAEHPDQHRAAEHEQERAPEAVEQSGEQQERTSAERESHAIEQSEGEAAEQAAAEAIEQPEQAPQKDGQQDALSGAMAEQQTQRDAQQAQGQQDATAQALAHQQEQVAAQQTEGRDDALSRAMAQQQEQRTAQPEQEADQPTEQIDGQQDALSRALAQQQAQRDAQQAEGGKDATAEALAEQQAQRDAQQADGHEDAVEKALGEQQQEREQQESGQDGQGAEPERDDDRER